MPGAGVKKIVFFQREADSREKDGVNGQKITVNPVLQVAYAVYTLNVNLILFQRVFLVLLPVTFFIVREEVLVADFLFYVYENSHLIILHQLLPNKKGVFTGTFYASIRA